ncbi:hypothetical protein [Chloroherpeton thalassium]|uniref:hypothetical protein n=1 Tax=Chloroherpeton thalassium TaxID=100716 RepID=UPI0002E037FC|nr:hypothetical protein [Chloroherpeton thalassium]
MLLLTWALFSVDVCLAGTPSPFGRKALAGRFSLGFHPSFVKNNNFLFFTHLGYGLNSSMSLTSHFSFQNTPFDAYAGLDLRAALLNHDRIKLDTYLGAHLGGLGNGYDAGAICNVDFFSSVGLVMAIDADILSGKNSANSPVHFIAGLDIPITRNMGFILNNAFALNRAAYRGFSGGLILFL